MNRSIWAIAVMLVAAKFVACEKPEGESGPNPANANRTATPAPNDPSRVETYLVRGEVTMLPEPGNPASQFMVKHEPVPNYMNAKGEVVGMNSMTMPFPPADENLLEGLAVGDKVLLTWEVRWFGDPKSIVTKIEKLPPETELHFEAPQPTGG